MSESSPAGWYPDPFARHERRYWDGSKWTDQVASRGHHTTDPCGVEAPLSTPATELPAADWYPDPSGRHEHRYWDGTQWTDHVGSRGRQGIDAPVDPAAAPTIGRPNKKVERQAHKAGVGDGDGGGGTMFTEPVLVINQTAKLFGSTLGYAIYDQHGQQLGALQEVRRDLTTKARDRLRKRTDQTRTYRLKAVDMDGRVLMTMTRPEVVLKSRLIVSRPDGTTIGDITQETIGLAGAITTIAPLAIGGFAGLAAAAAINEASRRINPAGKALDESGHVRFGLEAGGQRLGAIKARSIQHWNFDVQDATGADIAQITKTWAGWAKERFTKADHYVVQMHRPLQDPLRSLVIAAALALDIALKQGDPNRVSGRRTRSN